MKRNAASLLIACIMVCLAVAQQANALSLNPFKREGRTRASSLLITANFLEPRLIVELAQYRTKQPILLLSPDQQGGYNLFFMPAGTKPMAETSDNFSDIIALINPKQIIILGNTDYVPAHFVDIAQKNYPVVVLSNNDWAVNAQSLADLLDQPKLPSLFQDYRTRLKAANQAAKDVN